MKHTAHSLILLSAPPKCRPNLLCAFHRYTCLTYLDSLFIHWFYSAAFFSANIRTFDWNTAPKETIETFLWPHDWLIQNFFVNKTELHLFQNHLVKNINVLSSLMLAFIRILQVWFTVLRRNLKGRSSRFPAHSQSVSFVVWPYINNVKVMISRL